MTLEPKKTAICIHDGCGKEFDPTIPETRDDSTLRPFWMRYCPEHRVSRKPAIRRKIFKVTIKHEYDESPDTSYLGEYSNNPSSEFSIDRAHSEDCQLQDPQAKEGIDTLERVIAYLTACSYTEGEDWDNLQAAIDTLIELQDSLQECDCSGGDMGRNEYRYFNPSFNYVDKSGKPVDGLSPEEVRKYTRQDYDRMESLNAGHWAYIGIIAVAEVGISTDGGKTFKLDRLTSGGLWGIESDSDRGYLEETEQEELSQLKELLQGYGFGRSTIAKAFKDVERVD